MVRHALRLRPLLFAACLLALCCAAPHALTPLLVIRREGTYLNRIKRPLSVQELETAIMALPPPAWAAKGRVVFNDNCWTPPDDLPAIRAHEKIIIAMLKKHAITAVHVIACD